MRSWKFLFVPLLLIVLANISSGQSIPYNYGIKIGLNSAKFSGDDASDFNSATGLNLGAMIRSYVNNTFFWQTEVLLSEKGGVVSSQIDTVNVDITFALNYFEIPLLIGFDLLNTPNSGINPVFYGGPYLAIKSSAKLRGDTDNSSTEFVYSDAKSLDYGFVLGGSIELPVQEYRVIFDLRYTRAFISSDNSAQSLDLKNSVITGSIGFMF